MFEEYIRHLKNRCQETYSDMADFAVVVLETNFDNRDLNAPKLLTLLSLHCRPLLLLLLLHSPPPLPLPPPPPPPPLRAPPAAPPVPSVTIPAF